MTSPAETLRRLRSNAHLRADLHRLAERDQQREREMQRLATAAAGAGRSNLAPAQVPYGVDLAAQWSWRFLTMAATTWIVLWLLDRFLVVVLPLVIALLITALVSPVVKMLMRAGLPRQLGSLLVVLLGVASVAVALTFVGTQVVQGFSDLSGQVVDGLERIRHWLQAGPLNASDSQIDNAIEQAQRSITAGSNDLLGQATSVGTTLGHVVAGMFIVLFATYFFLADGPLIWAWIVRIFPRAGRVQADSSGQVAWRSLTQFVRATVLVAAVDAIGIAVVAAVLGLPLVGAIGILVFLGAFVPMIGATVSGAVAVLVALVDQGPVTALIMLGGVLLVQQVEAHVLQPFLMGRFVSIHPLGVIVAIAMGVIVAGIAGALIAVPLVASLNAVVQHLASHTDVGDDPEDTREKDPLGSPPVADSESETPLG